MNENESNRIFLAAVDEIAPNRIRSRAGKQFTKGLFRDPPRRLIAEDLARMTWSHFESLAAEIALREYGGKVLLTPQSRDKGADVIVMGDSVNVLILCNLTKHDHLKSELPLREIHSARPFYERFTQVKFGKLLLVSNVKSYGRQIQETAKTLGVELMDEEYIIQRVRQYGITWQDLLRRLSQPRLFPF